MRILIFIAIKLLVLTGLALCLMGMIFTVIHYLINRMFLMRHKFLKESLRNIRFCAVELHTKYGV